MQTYGAETEGILTRLEALAASDGLTPRDTERCTQLLEALRKPVRVCLLGPVESDLRVLLYAMIGTDFAPDGLDLPPALEIRFGSRVRTQATLEDGTYLTCEGWPTTELLAEAPVFLQIDAPVDTLQHMSLLALSLETNPASHRPALSWASRRTDIAVWCTPSFSVVDSRIWANAPERLTHRAYLVETRSSGDLSARNQTAFTGYLNLPFPDDASPLLDQLCADIDEARVADLDAAQILLHHLGPLARPAASSGPAPDMPAPAPRFRDAVAQAHMRDILSEPTLFLSNAARALAEDLAWADPEAEATWASAALSRCAETAEGLRERAMGWPDDLPDFGDLSAIIEEAADMIMLLQMEPGPEQTEDAAGVLYQLRLTFDKYRLGMDVAA